MFLSTLSHHLSWIGYVSCLLSIGFVIGTMVGFIFIEPLQLNYIVDTIRSDGDIVASEVVAADIAAAATIHTRTTLATRDVSRDAAAADDDDVELSIAVTSFISEQLIIVPEFTMAIIGSGEGSLVVPLAQNFSESMVLSVALHSLKMLHIQESAVSTAALSNIGIVHPTMKYSEFDDEPIKFPSIIPLLEAVADTPEFFDYQIFDARYAFGSTTPSDTVMNRSIKIIVRLARVTWLVIPTALADASQLAALVASDGNAEVIVTTTGKIGDYSIFQVLLTSMTRVVRRLVVPRCSYSLVVHNGMVFEEGKNQCFDDVIVEKQPWLGGGVSVATMLALGMSRVTRLGIVSLLFSYTGTAMSTSETRWDNILCCRGGRFVGVHKALRGARPNCKRNKDGTFSPKNIALVSKEDADFALRSTKMSKTMLYNKLFSSERLQIFLHGLFGCLTDQKHKSSGIDDYCNNHQDVFLQRPCFLKKMLSININP